MDVVNPVLHSIWPGQDFLLAFFLFFKIWNIPPIGPRSIPVIVDKRVNSPSASPASPASCWWREWIGVHPSGSIGQHSRCLRQNCQRLITWGQRLWNRWRF
ncbi:unnamed protein product [Prunus armeniaca]